MRACDATLIFQFSEVAAGSGLGYIKLFADFEHRHVTDLTQ